MSSLWLQAAIGLFNSNMRYSCKKYGMLISQNHHFGRLHNENSKISLHTFEFCWAQYNELVQALCV